MYNPSPRIQERLVARPAARCRIAWRSRLRVPLAWMRCCASLCLLLPLCAVFVWAQDQAKEQIPSATERLLRIKAEQGLQNAPTRPRQRSPQAKAAAEQPLSATERLLQIKKEQEAPQANAAEIEVESLGVAGWDTRNASRSREDALEEALRQAVQQVGGIVLTSETAMRNFELVQDDVSLRSQGFVRRYEILEEKREDAFYHVRIRAWVSRKSFLHEVDESLASLYERVGRPRIMLHLQPLDGGEDPLRAVEKEVRKALLQEGLRFVDLNKLRELQIESSAAVLLQQARLVQAELVMFGVSYVRTTQRGLEASIAFDVLRTDSGQIIASDVVTAQAPPGHADDPLAALRGAVQQLIPQLAQQISYTWIREKNEGGQIELMIKNISFPEFIALQQRISTQLHGVQSVRQRAYSEQAGQLEIVSNLPAARFAELLYAQPGAPHVEIESLQANTIIARKIEVQP